MLSRFKRFFIFIIIILIGLTGFLAWYFISNDAPAIHGEIIWHQDYKDNLKLDIYPPTQLVHKKTPVVLYIHGGAWIGGRKEMVNLNRFNGAFNRLREQGYAIVSPEYTLARREHSPFPACIIDAFDAVKWVENNADKYNFDLDNVGVLGESAGAHIALMIAYAEEDSFGLDDSRVDLRYVVDAYGPSDLKELYNSSLVDSLRNYLQRLPESLEERLDITQFLFGFDPEEDTVKSYEFMKQYSPVTYLDESDPPTLMVHGNNDRIVPVEQSQILKENLDLQQVDNEFHMLSGVNHALRKATSEQKDSVQLWIVDFIMGKYHSDR